MQTVLRKNVRKGWVWYLQKPAAAVRNGKDIADVYVLVE